MIFNFTNLIPNMTEEEKKECESRAIQNEREDEARLYGARLKCSNIPNRFLSASFENYFHDTLEQEKCLETAKKYSDCIKNEFSKDMESRNPVNLIISGPVGTGKTMLAVCIIKDFIATDTGEYKKYNVKSYHKGKYTNAADLVYDWGRIKDFKEKYTEDNFKSTWMAPEILVIDEIGRGLNDKEEPGIIGRVIDLRYNKNLPSVVITNLSIVEMVNYLGKAAISRIAGNYSKIDTTGIPDQRCRYESLRK